MAFRYRVDDELNVVIVALCFLGDLNSNCLKKTIFLYLSGEIWTSCPPLDPPMDKLPHFEGECQKATSDAYQRTGFSIEQCNLS